MFRKIFIQNFVNPVIWKYIKWSKRFDIFSNIQIIEKKSLESNLISQRKKLFEMIKYCDKNIAYYNKIIKDNSIKYTVDTINEDIKKFPILNKDILKKEFNNLKNSKFNWNFITNRSWWSTWEPVKFLQNSEFLDEIWAMKMLFNKRAWRNEWEYMIKLWWSDSDIIKWSQWLRWFLVKNFMNFEILNSFNLNPKLMDKYVSYINKTKPCVIEAYTQSIYEFANYIKLNQIKIYSPKWIITSAWTLYPYMRSLIEEVFNCKVYNRYWTREVWDIWCTCEEWSFHINTWNHYLEILDDKKNHVNNWETWKIYITTLNNYIMPLIRYEIWDIWTKNDIENSICKCWRWLPIVKNIEGREMSVFKTKDWKIIAWEFFIHFIWVVHNKWFIEKFQVIQEDYNQITIKVILKDKVSFENEKNHLTQNIKKVMWDDCNIIFETVKEIPSLPSWKYLYTISNIK